jgi:hypothetical protein
MCVEKVTTNQAPPINHSHCSDRLLQKTSSAQLDSAKATTQEGVAVLQVDSPHLTSIYISGAVPREYDC